MLDAYDRYCKHWKLTVNMSGEKTNYEKVFYLDTVMIENINEYNYLRIWFEKNLIKLIYTHV